MDHQLAHIKRYYQNQSTEHPDALTRPYLYLSKLEMDEFVIDASDQLENIYHILWPVAPDLAHLKSALQLLDNQP